MLKELLKDTIAGAAVFFDFVTPGPWHSQQFPYKTSCTVQ
jgi:hypothetical protein